MSSHSIRRAALEKWKQTHGSNATYNNLIGVFKRAGYQGYADTVYKVFGKFIQELFLSVKGLYLVTILSLLTGDPPTSQAVCGARADPQTSPQECQECQECATAASLVATVGDCRMERQKSCESTDDSSDDEMFSTPPTSLPPPDRVSYH